MQNDEETSIWHSAVHILSHNTKYYRFQPCSSTLLNDRVFTACHPHPHIHAEHAHANRCHTACSSYSHMIFATVHIIHFLLHYVAHKYSRFPPQSYIPQPFSIFPAAILLYPIERTRSLHQSMREPEFLFFFFFNGICAKEGSLCPFSSIYTYTYERTCSTIFCTWDILYYATYAILLLPHVNTNRYTNGMGLHCCIRQQNVYVAMYIRIILWYIQDINNVYLCSFI